MDNKALNNTLEAVANGTTSIDDCTTVLLQHVRTVVRKFLKANPTHGYLKDDLIASGSLSMVMTCQRFQREGVEIANTGYLSTCIWNGLLDTVRLEQVITPPRSFKGLLTNPEDMPARVPLDDIAVDTWEDAKHFDELVEGLNTTETEQ
jgi:DNA-directed RNA polymerase specialized sigma subunit